MSDNVLVTLDRDPLFGMTRESYVARLKSVLAGRVNELYVFGSFTGEGFDRFSDIDLIIICETDIPFVERSFLFSDLLDLVPATDILVYTPDEFSELMNNAYTGFWKSVKQSMVKII